MAEPSSQAGTLGNGDRRPDFLRRLGVLLPCSEEDVKAAFRQKVMLAHPDRGGSVAAFRQVEDDYQAAMQYAAVHGDRRTWLAGHIERYGAQLEVVDYIRRRGGEAEIKSLDWLRHEVGDDFAQVLDTLVGVRFNGPEVTVSDLRFLAQHPLALGNILKVDLRGARIGNLSVRLLRQFPNLRHLNLAGTCVTSGAVPELVAMRSLESVNLAKTFIGWWGRFRLRSRRPDLQIERPPHQGPHHRGKFRKVAATVLLYGLLCFTLTHLPLGDLQTPDWQFIPFDKFVHFSMYAGLGFLLAWLVSVPGLRQEQGRTPWGRRLLGVIGIVAAYGLFDERTQPMFGRTYDLTDWGADLLGGLCGGVLFGVLAWWRHRRWSESAPSAS